MVDNLQQSGYSGGTVAGIRTVRDMEERELFEERLKQHFRPSFYKKVISWMKPDIALGTSVGPDAQNIINRILLIIFGSLVLGIISTLAWYYVEGGKKNEQILIAVFSISWFMFVSFLFLLFEKTRTLHIVSFFTLLCLCSAVQDDYIKNDKTETKGGKLLTASTCLAGIVGLLLLFSYVTSRKEEELYELKTQMKKERDIGMQKDMMREHIKQEILKERQQLKEELEGKDATVRREIANAFIEDVMNKAKAGKLVGGGGGGQQKNKKGGGQKFELKPSEDDEDK